MDGLKPVKLDLESIENQNSSMERDKIIITILGRSHKYFDKLFKDIVDIELAENKLHVYSWYDKYWTRNENQIRRNMDSVIIDDTIKEEIIGFLDDFNSNEQWYIDHGLSYQTGILLYSPPGCGKTSLVKAIASKYKKNLYILSPSSLHDIEKAMSDLEPDSILLIEDIDSNMSTHRRRKAKRNKDGSESIPSDLAEELAAGPSNISDILNSIDGIIASHNRILIATTNHVEKLDDALLREGRFDLKIELTHVTNEMAKRFFELYFKDFVFPTNFDIKDNISPAKVQNLILKNLNDPKRVLEELKRG